MMESMKSPLFLEVRDCIFPVSRTIALAVPHRLAPLVASVKDSQTDLRGFPPFRTEGRIPWASARRSCRRHLVFRDGRLRSTSLSGRTARVLCSWGGTSSRHRGRHSCSESSAVGQWQVVTVTVSVVGRNIAERRPAVGTTRPGPITP